MKGSQPIQGSIHLGCKFDQDKNDVLYRDPNQYINHMEDVYCYPFKDNPNTKVKLPLEPSYYPELEISLFLNEDDSTQIYQSLIGDMQ